MRGIEPARTNAGQLGGRRVVAHRAFAVVRPGGVDTVALEAGVAHTVVKVCGEERHRDDV